MIIYQVYPRSFRDGNGDGVGDLAGLCEKLPYLAALGVELVWISPFFKSPMKDFGYDVSDYCAIDPLFGSMADFDRMMARARELGLGIMIDMVLSHSSDEHPWFEESRGDRENPKANWYVWADPGPDGGVPNNWQSLFGGSSAWEWNEARKQYYLHNFLKEQPDFNFHEPEVRKALLEACEFWLKKGVTGFRLDVCNFYFHSRALENNPPRERGKTEGVHAGNPYNTQMHVYDKDQKENLDFLSELRALGDRYPGSVFMGEVVSDDSLGVMGDYISGGKPLHTAYNFSLFRDSFDGNALAEVLREFEGRLPKGQPSWALGNHDVPRSITRFGGEAGFPQSAKCFLFFLFCLRGNVILYQGDELGLSEAKIPYEQMRDPFGIAFYPEFQGRDGCRTPLPWESERPRTETWLPIPDEHLPRCVAIQEPAPDSVLSFVKELIRWRRENPWLESAPVEVVGSSKDYLVLSRPVSAQKKFWAVINGSARELEIHLAGRDPIQVSAYGFKHWME